MVTKAAVDGTVDPYFIIRFVDNIQSPSLTFSPPMLRA